MIKKLICKIFGHDYEQEEYDNSLNMSIGSCSRCGISIEVVGRNEEED